MERLTVKDKEGKWHIMCNSMCGDYGGKCDSQFDVDMCKRYVAIDKLAEYEQAEEDGLLIRLPCKVGSTVYLINSKYTKCTRENQEFDEYSCQGCEWLDCDSRKEYYIHTNESVSLEWIVRYSKDFGKTVFLTKAEAEQALAKMKGV